MVSGAASRSLSRAVAEIVADKRLHHVQAFARELASEVLSSVRRAQSVADVAGCAATSYQARGCLAESLALRKLSREVLEGVLLEWGPPARSLGIVQHCRVLEQLVVRSLECASETRDLQLSQRAEELAGFGSRLASEAGDTLVAKRFQAVGELASFHSSVSAHIHTIHPMGPEPLFNTVERCSHLSSVEFARFSRSSRPVVLERAPHVPHDIDFPRLSELTGSRLLRTQQHDPSSDQWAGMRDNGDATLEQIIQRWRDGNTECVVFDEPLKLSCPELLHKWKWPPFMEESNLIWESPVAGRIGKDPFAGHPSLFVQPAGSRCGIHVDAFRTQFAQTLLHGRKKWVFWPFSELDQARYMARRDDARLEVYRRRRKSRIIHFEQSFPAEERMSQDILGSCVEVEIFAGDSIFVPGGVPHQVINLEDSIAVSQNFVDAAHASKTASEMRWPVPYDELADFLETAASLDENGGTQGLNKHRACKHKLERLCDLSLSPTKLNGSP